MQVPIQPRRLVPEREAAQCPRATTQWFHWCLWALFLPWLLTWSGAKANLLNAFYRKNRTSPSWNGGGGDQFLLSLVVFLSLYACQVGTGWTPLTYMSQVTLNRMEPVLRDIPISCKLFQRPENCFDSAKTACVLVVLLCGEVVDIDTCSRAQ